MLKTSPKRATSFVALGLFTAIATSACGQGGGGSNWDEHADIRNGNTELEDGDNTPPESPTEPPVSEPPPEVEPPSPEPPLGTVPPRARVSNVPSTLSHAIVYTRVTRTRGTHEVELPDGSLFTLESPDIWDTLPDTRRVFQGFNAPGQLILRQADGSEQILYDCFKSSQPCVPLDPMVSFDGRKVLFSVYRGERLESAGNRTTLPNQRLAAPLEAQLHVVDLDTGKVSPLQHKPGVFDVSPAWLPDGRIMFASTRAGTEEPLLPRISPNNRNAEPQLYISEADGSGAVNITPHEVTSALHPYVLQSGRVAYSSQWLSHNLAYGSNNGSINWPTTLDNMWLIMDMDSRGGDMNALLGAHRNNFRSHGGRTKSMKALHFLGQRENSDICAANYYRANNLGLGDVFCWTPETIGVEGALPDFLPRNLYNVADWSKSNDEPSFQDSGFFMGKVGYPEGLENNQLLLTVGRGFCVQGPVRSSQERVAGQPEKRGCDVGLYATTRIPSTSMSDLALIVDHEDWHEFGARVVRPRQVATPALSNTGNGSCQLTSSDAGSAETKPSRPYQFNRNFKTTANNGGEIDGLSHAELAGMRFWEVVPHTSRQRTFKNSIGHQLRLLGDVPLLEDNSFKVALPCDTPYIMAGIDERGRVIKRDQVPQSLRPGEKRICTGCHLHSQEGRPYRNSMASWVMPDELLSSRPVPTYEEDIKPILQARCQSCHRNDYVPLMDYEKLVWDHFQESLPEDKRIQVSDSEEPRRRYGLQRPYSSKYVNTMFARESLLYWKAANERSDGRSDSTYDDDIDFGPDHPTNITNKELEILAAWLDSGATRMQDD